MPSACAALPSASSWLAVALPFGILMGSFGTARSTFAPVVTASGYIPIATLVP